MPFNHKTIIIWGPW